MSRKLTFFCLYASPHTLPYLNLCSLSILNSLVLCVQVNKRWNRVLNRYIWHTIPKSMSFNCLDLFSQLVLEGYIHENDQQKQKLLQKQQVEEQQRHTTTQFFIFYIFFLTGRRRNFYLSSQTQIYVSVLLTTPPNISQYISRTKSRGKDQ